MKKMTMRTGDDDDDDEMVFIPLSEELASSPSTSPPASPLPPLPASPIFGSPRLKSKRKPLYPQKLELRSPHKEERRSSTASSGYSSGDHSFSDQSMNEPAMEEDEDDDDMLRTKSAMSASSRLQLQHQKKLLRLRRSPNLENKNKLFQVVNRTSNREESTNNLFYNDLTNLENDDADEDTPEKGNESISTPPSSPCLAISPLATSSPVKPPRLVPLNDASGDRLYFPTSDGDGYYILTTKKTPDTEVKTDLDAADSGFSIYNNCQLLDEDVEEEEADEPLKKIKLEPADLDEPSLPLQDIPKKSILPPPLISATAVIRTKPLATNNSKPINSDNPSKSVAPILTPFTTAPTLASLSSTLSSSLFPSSKLKILTMEMLSGDGTKKCRDDGPRVIQIVDKEEFKLVEAAVEQHQARKTNSAKPDTSTFAPREDDQESLHGLTRVSFDLSGENGYADGRFKGGRHPCLVQCPQCERLFDDEPRLKRHLKMVHGPKAFCCPECNKYFTQYGHLQVHLRTVHTTVQPFDCQVCGRKFNVASNRNRHERLHFTKGSQHYMEDLAKEKQRQTLELIKQRENQQQIENEMLGHQNLSTAIKMEVDSSTVDAANAAAVAALTSFDASSEDNDGLALPEAEPVQVKVEH